MKYRVRFGFVSPIFLIAFVIFFFALGGVYYLSRSGKFGLGTKLVGSPTPAANGLFPSLTQNNETLTPEEAKKVQPLPDTASWKTYTNKAGYSLKYPSDWTGPTERLLATKSEVDFNNKLMILSGIFLGEGREHGLTFDQFLKTLYQSNKTTLKDYLLDNIKGKIYQNSVNPPEVETEILAPFPNNDSKILVISYKDIPGHTTKSEVINQVLSTFRFTN